MLPCHPAGERFLYGQAFRENRGCAVFAADAGEFPNIVNARMFGGYFARMEDFKNMQSSKNHEMTNSSNKIHKVGIENRTQMDYNGAINLAILPNLFPEQKKE